MCGVVGFAGSMGLSSHAISAFVTCRKAKAVFTGSMRLLRVGPEWMQLSTLAQVALSAAL